MHFLSGFSRPFMLALGLWPLASLALTLPVLAILYRRDGRLRLWSALGAYLSVLYLLSLVCFTLYPMPSGDSGLGITYGVAPQLDLFAFVDDIRRDGKAAVLQLVANVAFFVPLGFIVGRGLRRGVILAVVLGFLASLFVETAQLTGCFWLYPYAYRTFDVDDLACNTLGALIGWCVAALLNLAWPARRDDGASAIEANPGFVRRAVALCLDATLIVASWGILCAGAVLSAVVFEAAAAGDARFSSISALLARLTTDDTAWVLWLLLAIALLVEVVVPWCRDGRTPGGSFVRMTCESHPRTLPRRVVFYVLRTAALACLAFFTPVAVPVLAIFYLAARRMPYDYI